MSSDPLQVALIVADAIEACGLKYLVGGSLASSIGGEPRSTVDVDIIVSMTDGDIDCGRSSSSSHSRPDSWLLDEMTDAMRGRPPGIRGQELPPAFSVADRRVPS